MPGENYEIRVSTGKITVPIIDSDGETVGKITFNPTDVDILKRYEKVIDALNAITVPDGADADAIFTVSDELKRQVDFLLGYPVSEEIFGRCNPLTLTDTGDFYIEAVLAGIGELLEQITKQRIERKKAKIRKAAAPYKG